MTAVKLVSTARAATLLWVDASTVGKYVRVGLKIGKSRLKLYPECRMPGKRGGSGYVFRASEIKDFAAKRRKYERAR